MSCSTLTLNKEPFFAANACLCALLPKGEPSPLFIIIIIIIVIDLIDYCR